MGSHLARFPYHTFSKTIFHTFSIPNSKTLIPTFTFIFENFIHGTQCKSICKTVNSGKEQNLNKQIAELKISILLNTLCTFWSKSILFQDLENQFHNSILFQYHVGTLTLAPSPFGLVVILCSD